MTNTVQFNSSIPAAELARRAGTGESVDVLDVRTPGEFATGHVPGARLLPLDDLDPAEFVRHRASGDRPLYVVCQSGGRARRAIEKLQRAGLGGCVLVEGGIQAWMEAGLPVERSESRSLPLMRQVQIIAGALTATGAALALWINPIFAILPLVTGTGLLFAGSTGWCGMALLLAKMPWNKTSPRSSTSSCTA